MHSLLIAAPQSSFSLNNSGDDGVLCSEGILFSQGSFQEGTVDAGHMAERMEVVPEHLGQ